MVLLYNVVVVVAAIWYLSLMIRNKLKGVESKIYIICFSIVLIFLSACRYQSGKCDYANYRKMFNNYLSMSWCEIVKLEEEVGFACLLKLCSYLSTNPQIIFLPCSLLIIIPFVCFFCKYSEDAPFSLLLFVAFIYYFSSHNVMRQYVAAGILIISYNFAIKRKPIAFIVFILIASTIHTSALLGLLAYPLCSLRYAKKQVVLYTVLIPISMVCFPYILSFFQKFFYSDYVDGGYGMNKSNALAIVLPAILFLVLWIMAFNCKVDFRRDGVILLTTKDERLNNMVAHFISVNAIIGFCQISQILILGRLGCYFAVGVCLFVPKISNLFIEKDRIAVKVILVFLAVAYFMVFNSLGKCTPTPYDFFWNA